MPYKPLKSGDELEQHVRNRFMKWCRESQHTQKSAGAAIDWEQQTVSAYFRGDQQIDLVRAVRWCHFFGYKLEDLVSKSTKIAPNDERTKELVDGFNRASPKMQDVLLELVGALHVGKGAVPGRRRDLRQQRA